MQAFSLLLIKSNLGALQYSQTILDFVTMPDYIFYTEEILRYMSYTLI